MNKTHSTQRKEVTTLDDDVPLVRQPLIRFNVSELRSSYGFISRSNACHFLPCMD